MSFDISDAAANGTSLDDLIDAAKATPPTAVENLAAQARIADEAIQKLEDLDALLYSLPSKAARTEAISKVLADERDIFALANAWGLRDGDVEAIFSRITTHPGAAAPARKLLAVIKRKHAALAKDRAKKLVRKTLDEADESFKALAKSAGLPSGIVCPEGYEITRDGVSAFSFDKEGGQILKAVTLAPMLISKRFKDVTNSQYQLEVAWQTRDHWVKMTVPKERVKDSRSLIKLAQYDAPVDSSNASELVKFLSAFEAANIDRLPEENVTWRLGWQSRGCSEGFVMPGSIIQQPGQVPVTLAMRENYDQYAKGFHKRGSHAAWVACIEKHILHRPIPMVMLYASVASPLLHMLQQPGFIVDSSGDTSRGKCLMVGSRILDVRTGQLRAIEDFKVGDKVPTMLIGGQVGTSTIVDIHPDGVKPVVEVTLGNGRTITCTENHRLLCIQAHFYGGKHRIMPNASIEWRKVKDFDEATRVAVPDHMPFFGEEEPDLDEVKLLGYMIGDGSFGPSCGSPTFSQNSGVILDDFLEIAERLGMQPRYQRQLKKKCKTYRIRKGPFRALLEKYEIDWGRSGDHVVPPILFKSKKHIVAAFIKAYMEADGWLSVRRVKKKAKGVQIGLCSKSYELADGIRHLLLRFGVSASISSRIVRRGRYWSVISNSHEVVLPYLKEIGFDKYKDDRVAEAIALCEEESGRTRRYSYGGLNFERVISIEDKGEAEVLDLEIDVTHNFIAEDIVAHNSSALRVAASVWGLPDDMGDGIIKTWEATDTSLERMAGFFNSLPFLLDDTKHAIRDKGKIGKAMYFLPSGQGKDRGSIDGVRSKDSWRLVTISTGEAPITSFSEDAGARARCICLRGAPFGPQTEDNAHATQEIRRVLMENYGHLGPMLIDWLLTRRSWQGLIDKYEEFRTMYRGMAKDAVSGRLGEYMAALHLAATVVHGPMRVPPARCDALGFAWDACTRGGKEADRPREAATDLFGLAVAHEEEFWGRHKGSPSRGWYGAWSKSDSWDSIAFRKDVVQNALLGWGYDVAGVIDSWRRRGWLLTDSDSGTMKQAQVGPGGQRPRCIVVKREALEQSKTDGGEE